MRIKEFRRNNEKKNNLEKNYEIIIFWYDLVKELPKNHFPADILVVKKR